MVKTRQRRYLDKLIYLGTHVGFNQLLANSFLNQGQYSIRERDGRRSQDRARLFSPVC